MILTINYQIRGKKNFKQFVLNDDINGEVRAHINIGPFKSPTKQLKFFYCSKEKLQILQEEFDEIEREGVFSCPKDLNVNIEHISPFSPYFVNQGGKGL